MKWSNEEGRNEMGPQLAKFIDGAVHARCLPRRSNKGWDEMEVVKEEMSKEWINDCLQAWKQKWARMNVNECERM